MSALTAVVLGALGAYVLAMIGGQVPTDFALFLFVCTLVSGLYFAAEVWFFAPRRREQTVRALLEFDRRNRPAQNARPEVLAKERSALQEALSRRPWWSNTRRAFPGDRGWFSCSGRSVRAVPDPIRIDDTYLQ